MGKRYMTRAGTWNCGGLVLRAGRPLEIGEGNLPDGFKDWSEVEALLERHSDKGVRYFEVPRVEDLEQAEAETKEPEPPEGPATLYACPYCGASFEGIDKLRQHMDGCPKLAATGHYENEGAERVVPLTVPDEAEEKAAGEAEARVRQEQAEAEAKAKAEKKARDAKIYGNKASTKDKMKAAKAAAETTKKRGRPKKEPEAAK